MKDINDCWNHIGVFGDSSCQELPRVTHCHHCSIFADAGRGLLDREPPLTYLEEWTTILRKAKESKDRGTFSVLLFRLAQEWFALDTKYVREIIPVYRIRALPHRKNDTLLGIVNVHGELHLCVSLSHMLQISGVSNEKPQRMVVIEKDNARWIFPAQEVAGLHRLTPDETQTLPGQSRFSSKIFSWKDQFVNYMDHEPLFHALARSCS